VVGELGGSIKLVVPDDVPRAASALLDPSTKTAARKMEKVGFIGLPPSCVANSIEVSCKGS
jgi:hypothetical protein